MPRAAQESESEGERRENSRHPAMQQEATRHERHVGSGIAGMADETVWSTAHDRLPRADLHVPTEEWAKREHGPAPEDQAAHHAGESQPGRDVHGKGFPPS